VSVRLSPIETTDAGRAAYSDGMPTRFVVALGAAFLALLTTGPALAGPGDVVIPAHRTSDGTAVPASVPTTSGGTYLPIARRGKIARQALRPTSRGGSTARPVPIFSSAAPIVR